MSSTGKNFVFAYSFLVILPLVGLAGVLRSGRTLQAPATIDGAWTVSLDSPQNNSTVCANVVAALAEKPLSISQSGTGFVLSVPGNPPLEGSGTLAGKTLRASFERTGGFCGGHAATLIGSLNQQAGTLTGTLAVADCPSCAPVAFLGQRAIPGKGGH